MIGLVLALRRSRHRLFVVAYAILVQEVEVNPIVRDKFVRDTRNERRVGARTDRQPFRWIARRSFVQTIIDVDDLGSCFTHRVVVPDHIRAAHAVVGGGIAEHQDQVGVLCLIDR